MDLEPGRNLARIAPYAECMRGVISNAIVKVGRPTVTAYATAHGIPFGDAGIKIASNT
jgi:hypothetical protein